MRRTASTVAAVALLGLIGCGSTAPTTAPTTQLSKVRDRTVTIRGVVDFRPDLTPPPNARLQIAVRLGRYGPMEKELVFENLQNWPVEYEFVLPGEDWKGEGNYMLTAHAFTNGQLTHLAPFKNSDFLDQGRERWVGLQLIPVRD